MPDTSSDNGPENGPVRPPPFDTVAVNPPLAAADPATVEQIRAFMAEDKDLPSVPVRMRYLILSQPRTGGTLLSAALERCGHAGVPFEYLNPACMTALFKRLGTPNKATSLHNVIAELEDRRTTANGVFGLHLHLEQLSKVLKTSETALRWINRFDHIIFLYRRDKLAQAISLYRSVQSTVWFESTTEDGDRLPREWLLDPWMIARHVANLGGQEGMIRTALATLRRPVIEISYEMLDQEFAATWKRVLEFLGLPETPAEQVYPDLRRMRDDASEKLAERFMAALRDSDLALDDAFVRIAGRRTR